MHCIVSARGGKGSWPGAARWWATGNRCFFLAIIFAAKYNGSLVVLGLFWGDTPVNPQLGKTKAALQRVPHHDSLRAPRRRFGSGAAASISAGHAALAGFGNRFANAGKWFDEVDRAGEMLEQGACAFHVVEKPRVAENATAPLRGRPNFRGGFRQPRRRCLFRGRQPNHGNLEPLT